MLEILAEKARVYAMPVGVILAALVFFWWYVFADSIVNALFRAVIILIFAYPYLLRYAVPSALHAGLARAARTGIQLRNASVFKKLEQVKIVVFNKTGVLTTGNPDITDFVVFDDALPLADALYLAASLESACTHPIGRAIAEKGLALKRSLATPFEFKEISGMGVSGVVEGKHIEIGNLSYLEGLAANVQGKDMGFGRFQTEGKTVVFMFIDKKLTALIALADSPRPFAKEMVAAIRDVGKEIVLLTGDNKKTAEAAAHALGITEMRAEVFPRDRARIIEELQKDVTGKARAVALVGDGSAGDAGARAQADVNICFCGNSRGSYDVVCANDDIRNIATLFVNTKKTMLTVKMYILLQFAWYAIALPIASAIPLDFIFNW
ncbi:MAG: hypothetical protein A3C08_02615 [Candidatus Taylorbacteria bacterium RIFCSPHIGHO2_02_FULL_47_18]|uniref:Copper-translocating P-type ATPase n=1 Tax=Candidatus Taylorbacteria bacterium RIFCSPLOWO2_01_FULL_48_100 TaxID=1802322 RepID=A0A1G2NDW7_9BACT|nr:MAG: hypothetical protein A2670_02325 [Candidatus Taylorbacteria bacterium RIFCSPHIGHO2_01_FULL_48_38]OHA27593.1 MAG: hypothetical protein A3C08_02615 [Candidatus Taylorbacteria bacterium RIFCSPHIGHO2_02_FULL_47_18]OHA34285.1 MAG: hypothetical protein A2938_02000 [Candidatus Taylorbacteria bacterium RIFCSPLOWO2_01_FULL_48_100]OHA44921.1 MAG: hypothetical protein A3H13_03390 [Candidatus Taylorbacteria bacterium RIFCSPLOWO2_12_FULL_48_11]